ncbi:(2Fe-2S)-binding protein [Actinokineospora auranticolor]|uniref:Carbon-monoxide dehydrogenase small subunit n=1 Tax=Actinokineospora auranticolor TaxID=155976 RepID=A0A2S6GK48_9PSEU|nr:(2Fe-2S)-binding protein [Actinokineospora auranticolor]PPK65589.1 carbon-monoxide dehydrogenase small subunit [Actinokineospora auranticolor]
MTTAEVNGRPRDLPEDGRCLADWIRDDLGLTGTKIPCGSGHCGGCSVLLDGRPVLSCSTPAVVHEDGRITTVEGLAARQDPLLRSFVEHGAAQCGYCTAGMLVAARAYLDECGGAAPDEAGARRALSGNVCRCTGYTAIVAAVLAAGRECSGA